MASYRVMSVVTLLTLLTPESFSQQDVCGKAVLNTRIVGGQSASPGNWPWQVGLFRNGGLLCGGSLINNQWVLTAAHCFSSTDPSGLIVLLGGQSLAALGPNAVLLLVTQIISHPNYKPDTLENDISLLKLSSPVNFTNYILPVCLAASDSSFYNGTDAWVAGWGNIASGVPPPAPFNLTEVEVPVVGNRQCNCNYGVGTITDNMMCAGVPAGGKGFCQGDGGGPLVSKQNGRWIQAGIVSFGIGCALPNLPGVYTRVSQYQSWINNQITSDPPGFVTFTSSGTDGDLNVTCPTLPPPVPLAPAPTAELCGQAGFNTRIIGGQEAPPGNWPWQAAIYTNGNGFCGGSLINHQWVLTAAHCFPSNSTSNVVVYLGNQRLITLSPYKVVRTVTQIINHPNYNPSTADNDITLLKLSSPVNFTTYLLPVCLAASNSSFYNGTDAWATGWGVTESGSLPAVPFKLREVEVPVVGNRQCNCDYGVGTITDNMMCTGVPGGGKSPCQGDGGGPLVSSQKGRWIQAGVTSFAIGCALPNLPEVYTRVSRYQSWINSQITSDPPGFVTFTSTGTDGDLDVTCPTLPPSVNLSPAPTAQLCGQAGFNTRIIGGQEAPPGNWPWQAALYRNGYFRCGGSLINNQWVLAAASCFPSNDTSNVLVYLGTQTILTLSPYKVVRTVTQIINHPNYNPSTFDSDISLLKLSSPVNFTAYLLPVCLAASNSSFYNGTDAWATGWGVTESGSLPAVPFKLREVEVPVVGNRQCNCDYGVGSITDNMMCAGVPGGGKSPCQGDGGGPLVSSQKGRWIQAGVTSFAIGCALPNLPEVYTRVSRYQSWINSQITSDSPGFVTFTSTGTDGDLNVTCPTLPPSVNLSPAPTAQLCGQVGFNTRIIGGQEAPPGNWPWQAAIYTNGNGFCGGSLINNQWVLTAAHCFPSNSTSNVVVYLGTQRLITLSPYKVVRTVTQIINHPNYNPSTFDNDISLLKLSSPVNFTTYLLPVCLAASNSSFYNGTDTWATGWGVTESGASPAIPFNLREVEIPVVGNRQCNCNYGVGTITDNMMCAGLPAGGKDTCQGDVGGPLVSKQNGRWVQGGITSFGIGCALPNLPGIYTRVSQYQSWINSQITSDQPGFVTFTSSGTDGDLNVTCPTLPPPVPLAPAPTAELCGQAGFNTRIIGGQEAPPGNWPWQAAIYTNGNGFCGGSLINHQWVLTAAHCFPSNSTSNVVVYLGNQRLITLSPYKVVRTVTQIINHPNYNPSTADNDITLLKLSSPVNFTTYLLPVCLAASNSSFYNGTDTWATGWGVTESGAIPQNLREVEVPVVGNRQCNCNYGVGTITDNMMCAGLPAGGKDTCQDDDGGPLVSKQSGRWVQGGITSFGIGCALPNLPGVYTRVSQYQSWINSQITSDPPGFVTFTSSGTDGDLNATCPTLPPPVPLAPAPTAELCGQAGFNTRIIGGQEAPPGNWPWQAAILINGTSYCGGSLINKQWVLTAAHCFPSNSTSNVFVYLGNQRVITFSPYKVVQTVTQIRNHPNYKPSTGENDISLLKLSSPVNFTTYLFPVCLAASGSTFYNGTNAWVTGWGDIGNGVFLPFPLNLREVEVPVVGNRQCNCGYEVGTITDNMMCAGLSAGGKGPCQGDDGGPLVTKQNGRWILGGIVSSANGCSNTKLPGIYTRVSQYQSWINSTITSDSPGFVTFKSSGTDGDLNITCLTVTPPTVTAKPVVCGQAPLSSRILGKSTVATAGEWPWMASLQRNGSHVCGGTLVAVDSVLTNADCFSSSRRPSDWTVVLGRQKQNGSNPFEVTLNVTNITLSNLTGSNVAVLRLVTPPTLSNYIQPICLDNGRTFSVGSTCWAAGWSSGQGGVEQVLQEIQTSVVNCGNTTSDSICTTSFTLEQGESGGPLMCKQDGSWFQAAVLTVGNSTTIQTRESIMSFPSVNRFKVFLLQTIGGFLSPPSTFNTTVNATQTTNLTTSGGPTSQCAFFFFFHLLIFSMFLHFFV